PHIVSSAGHHWYPGDEHVIFASYDEYTGINTADGYHTYGWEWTPQHLKFYVDGVLIRIVDYPGPHAAGQNVWLTSLAFTLPVDDVSLPGEVSYDYFRYYTKDYGVTAPSNAIVIDNA